MTRMIVLNFRTQGYRGVREIAPSLGDLRHATRAGNRIRRLGNGCRITRFECPFRVSADGFVAAQLFGEIEVRCFHCHDSGPSFAAGIFRGIDVFRLCGLIAAALAELTPPATAAVANGACPTAA